MIMIYIICGFFVLISLLLITIVGVDVFLYYRSVFYRIKIGRWTDRSNWLKNIQAVNLKWLKKTPTVKLTDNERYVVKDMIKGRYRSTTIQSWQEAGVLFGALLTDNAEEQTKYFIDARIDKNTRKWKNIPQHVDGAILAYALTKTTENAIELKPALDEIITLIENCKGDDGTVFYRDFIPDIRFVDTIGFICPFLTFYGKNFDEPKYIDLAILQIKSYVEKALLKKPFLPAHAFEIKKNMPLGIYGWGRGSGWFIIGLIDTYAELPEDHVDREYIKELILKTAADLINFQKPNGSFHSVLSIQTRHDSSITTLAGLLFLTTYKITGEEKYYKAADNCVTSLMKVTRRDGVVDFCQGDTKGIGVYAETFDLMPFVQGLVIRLTTELEKTTKK